MHNLLNCRNYVSKNKEHHRAGRICPKTYKSPNRAESQNNISPCPLNNNKHLETQGHNQNVEKGCVSEQAESKKIGVDENQHHQTNSNQAKYLLPAIEVREPLAGAMSDGISYKCQTR